MNECQHANYNCHGEVLLYRWTSAEPRPKDAPWQPYSWTQYMCEFHRTITPSGTVVKEDA
jgi:hypothetical protein